MDSASLGPRVLGALLAARDRDVLRDPVRRAAGAEAQDEAEVVGYVAGEGKYRGALGALIVRTADGREFRLGTGFSDDERFSPPPLGAQVTFSYNGLTEHGLPRFARFVRVRPQE